MALENLVIHDIAGGDFNPTGYTYHQVMWATSATAVLNGTSVLMTAPIVINLRLRSASTASTGEVFALGYQMAIEPLPLHFMSGGFR